MSRILFLLVGVLFSHLSGLSIEEKINNTTNPFSTKKGSKPTTTKVSKTSKKSIKIDAIINNSLLFKNKWYKKGQKIEDCTILQINKFNIKLICKNRRIRQINIYK